GWALPAPTGAGGGRCCAAGPGTGSAGAPHGWSERKRPDATAWTRAGHYPKRAASPAPTWPPPCWTPSPAPTSTAGPHTSPTNLGRTRPGHNRRHPRLTGYPPQAEPHAATPQATTAPAIAGAPPNGDLGPPRDQLRPGASRSHRHRHEPCRQP